MKPFLLIAGNYDSVNTRTSSWFGCFSSEKEADSNVKFVNLGNKNCYKISCGHGGYYDWVEIVDLRKWTA